MPASGSHTFSRRSLAVGSVALGVMTLMSHAARAQEQPDASPEASLPDGSELLLRMERRDGTNVLARVLGPAPEFSLYDDGSIYRLGPMIAIYPPPALPNVTRMRVSAAAVATIMEWARQAGLDQGQEIAAPPMQETGPSVLFSFNADDGMAISIVPVSLIDGEPLPDGEEATPAADQRLRELTSFLANLPLNLPAEELLEQEMPVDPERLQVFAFEASPDQELPAEIVDLEQPPLAWPLDTPLAELATPWDPSAGSLPDGRCAVLTGPEARAVVEASRQGNLLSPWVDGDATYAVALKPLLPDQAECGAAG